MDVFFYEAFAEEVEALRACLPATIRAGFAAATIQETGQRQPPARLISIRTQSRVPPGWDLVGIVSRTTGYDHLTGLKIPCGYLPLYCARAVAEQALLLWLALLRKLPQQITQFARFDRDGLTGGECAGRKLLVVGAGHIGSEIVAIGRALGMEVRRVDILPERADISIEAGLPWAEIIVCAMNLTADNAGYFDYRRLKQARRGALFINIARGELSPTADLARLLDEGHLGGVALDVYDREAEVAVELRAGRATFPLAGRPNVMLTPHNAFNTREALARKAEQTARQVEQFLRSGRMPWPVP